MDNRARRLARDAVANQKPIADQEAVRRAVAGRRLTAAGNITKPKKLRTKLVGLQEMNDAARAIVLKEKQIANKEDDLVISGQPRPPSKLLEIVQNGKKSTKLNNNTLSLQEQQNDYEADRRQHVLPQLGRHAQLNFEKNRRSILTENAHTVQILKKAHSKSKVESVERRNPRGEAAYHGSLTTLSAGTKSKHMFNQIEIKKSASRSKHGMDYGATTVDAVAAAQNRGNKSPLKNSLIAINNQQLAGEDGKEQGHLTNYSLMEQLSKAY